VVSYPSKTVQLFLIPVQDFIDSQKLPLMKYLVRKVFVAQVSGEGKSLSELINGLAIIAKRTPAGFVPAIVNDTSFMFDWTREDGIEIPKDKLQKAIAELEAKTVKMVRMNPYELVTKVYNN